MLLSSQLGSPYQQEKVTTTSWKTQTKNVREKICLTHHRISAKLSATRHFSGGLSNRRKHLLDPDVLKPH